MKNNNLKLITTVTIIVMLVVSACKPKNIGNAVSADAAPKAYVAPGKYDAFYNFVSGGFSVKMSVYCLPSGRLLSVITFFLIDPENGCDYSE